MIDQLSLFGISGIKQQIFYKGLVIHAWLSIKAPSTQVLIKLNMVQIKI